MLTKVTISTHYRRQQGEGYWIQGSLAPRKNLESRIQSHRNRKMNFSIEQINLLWFDRLIHQHTEQEESINGNISSALSIKFSALSVDWEYRSPERLTTRLLSNSSKSAVFLPLHALSFPPLSLMLQFKVVTSMDQPTVKKMWSGPSVWILSC